MLTPQGRIYLDHAATTPVHPLVRERILQMLDRVGNPQSVHQDGEATRQAVEQARGAVARLIGAKPREIVFTGGGTEAVNLALFGLFPPGSGGHIVSSRIEHSAVLQPLHRLEQTGVRITLLPAPRSGQLQTEAVLEAISPDTRLVTLQVANNETGVIHDLSGLGQALRERGILLHLDAIQGAGLLPLDVSPLQVDLLSLSAQKMYGPQGVGALFVRQGVTLTSRVLGGRHERGRRAGTENTPGIAGFGMAAELALQEREARHAHLASLTEYLEDGLQSRIPDLHISGREVSRLPGFTHLVLPGLSGEGLVQLLDQRGFSLSHGAACSGGGMEASHVLLAMGFPEAEAKAALRITGGLWTREPDLHRLLDVLPPLVERLRGMSRVSTA